MVTSDAMGRISLANQPGALCDSIATPTEGADGLEAVARRIWVAIGKMAQTS